MAPHKRLAAGKYFFDYIQDNGEVYSWGYYQGLGAGNVANSAFPLQMLGVSAASYLSAGAEHACIVDAGAAKCCGLGSFGQLGNNASITSLTAVQVQGLTTGVAQVYAGGRHSCAILQTGGMQCWGKGDKGQLGNGGNTQSNVPVDVVNYASSGVSSACAGETFTCIVTTAGAALRTGNGYDGQLGSGGTANQNVMAQVDGLTTGVTQISCGLVHTCALLSTGALSCFGWDYYGQLGMGDDASKLK